MSQRTPLALAAETPRAGTTDSLVDATSSLEEAFSRAGLTCRHKHLLIQRLTGRSLEDVAHDPQMARGDGRGACTKQNLQKMERVALSRLGVNVSMADLHRTFRIDRALDEVERGRATRDAHGRVVATDGARAADEGPAIRARGKRRLSRIEQQTAALDALAAQMLKEDDRGELTDERRRWYDERARRIHSGADR